MKQNIRIIGGQFRGKKLAFPDIEGLRPTPDRVRETLFNWLMRDIQDARCLDAFAGSGALGFEAFSRGAEKVYLIEKNQAACKHLQTSINHFQSSKIKLLKMDVLDFLKQQQESFDIIFLDPPFDSELLEQCIKQIESSNILAPEGLLYTESGHALTMDSNLWQQLKSKRAGQVHYGLYQRIKP